MKKVLALFCVVILVGCGSSTDETIDKTSPFLGGTEGISVDFLNLRASVFDKASDPFDIVVQLQNKGEFDVRKQDVRVKISGLNPAEFSKLDEAMVASPEDDVLGVRKDAQGNALKGPPTTVEFKNLNYLGKIVGASQKFPVVIDSCYGYETTAVSYLCSLTDVLMTRTGSVCEINEAKPSFNSAGPIQVVTMQEFPRGRDKIGFTFDVKHVGAGSVYGAGSKCVNERFKNKLIVNVDTRLDGLQCTGLNSKSGSSVEGEIILQDTAKTISCTQILAKKADFEQSITITTKYDYNVQKKADITVKSSGQE